MSGVQVSGSSFGGMDLYYLEEDFSSKGHSARKHGLLDLLSSGEPRQLDVYFVAV